MTVRYMFQVRFGKEGEELIERAGALGLSAEAYIESIVGMYMKDEFVLREAIAIDPPPVPVVADPALMTELLISSSPVPKKKLRKLCYRCGDDALYLSGTSCGPNGCYNCPA